MSINRWLDKDVLYTYIYIYVYSYISIKMLYIYIVFSCFSHIPLFVTLWTEACQASLSMGFSRKEYWVGWHCLLQRIFNPEIEPTSLMSSALAGRFFTNCTSYIYIYMVLFSHKKSGILPFASTWIDPEVILVNEIRKRKTDTAYYNLHVDSKQIEEHM